MAINKIIIQHFRNIHYAEVEPSPTINFIIGENGSGKTNFLESLYTLGHGRAFRHQQHQHLISYQQNELSLYAKLDRFQQCDRIGLTKAQNGQSKIRINNNTDYKVADLAKLLPMQLMNPEGITLLMGGPKYKRAFIDWGCFHLYPEFYPLWLQFKRGIKQRNRALRQANSYEDLLHWDKILVPVAERIHQIRLEYLARFEPEMITAVNYFLPNFIFTHQLTSGWESNLSYQESLRKNFDRERLLKYTCVGPHKADFRLKVDQHLVEECLSRGQLKLLMCALRLAQGTHFQQATQQGCLYLLDDFTAELDPAHQQRLIQHLRGLGTQVFISAIEFIQIEPLLEEKDAIFKVICGKIIA